MGNYIDIGFAIIVFVLSLTGLRRGFVCEIMGIVGVLLGIYLASGYCVPASKYLEFAGLNFENRIILYTLAFVVILAVVWVACLVIGLVISTFFLTTPGIVYINYVLGYCFALIKYSLILCFVIYGLSNVPFLNQPIDNIAKDSKVYQAAQEVSTRFFQQEGLKEAIGMMKVNISDHVKNGIDTSIVDKAKKAIEEDINNATTKKSIDSIKKGIEKSVNDTTNEKTINSTKEIVENGLNKVKEALESAKKATEKSE